MRGRCHIRSAVPTIDQQAPVGAAERSLRVFTPFIEARDNGPKRRSHHFRSHCARRSARPCAFRPAPPIRSPKARGRGDRSVHRPGPQRSPAWPTGRGVGHLEFRRRNARRNGILFGNLWSGSAATGDQLGIALPDFTIRARGVVADRSARSPDSAQTIAAEPAAKLQKSRRMTARAPAFGHDRGARDARVGPRRCCPGHSGLSGSTRM